MPVVGTNAIAIVAGLLFTGALVVGVQFMPPLTQADPEGFPAFQKYRPLGGDGQGLIEASNGRGGGAIIDPGQYCRETLSGVNCGCFREKAVQVLSARRPRAAGWHYANDWDLATSQAAADCR
ncbi:hypothetical protein J4E08_00445 [Sagittula sp. NFXS13]|uniref:hypothetical protein n=1 Tax=Sagittula sp. NFXS13 TaxID=2819095 RepID=UPI0032DF0F70